MDDAKLAGLDQRDRTLSDSDHLALQLRCLHVHLRKTRARREAATRDKRSTNVQAVKRVFAQLAENGIGFWADDASKQHDRCVRVTRCGSRRLNAIGYDSQVTPVLKIGDHMKCSGAVTQKDRIPSFHKVSRPTSNGTLARRIAIGTSGELRIGN